jgi:CheY-like chemotaxis protein
MDRASRGTNRVLLVEDELLIALELSSMIEDAGWEVLGPAPNVEKALAILAQTEPVAAFLDENLNGASVAPVARELVRRRIPFVIVSGYARSISGDALLQKARRIQKPASPRQIRDALADFLSTARR